MARTSLKPRKLPSQRRSSATVDAIVEAAIRILLRDGYDALTTISVAERAGVSVGSLYQYFPSKQSIVAEVIRRRTAEIINALAAVDTGDAPNIANAVDRLVAALLIEKQRGLALARALNPAMAETEGRSVIIEAGRSVVPQLAQKLAPALGRTLSADDQTSLAIAVAAVDGAIWEAVALAPEQFETPALRRQLSAILLSAVVP